VIGRAYLFVRILRLQLEDLERGSPAERRCPLSLLAASVDVCPRAVSSCQVGLQVRFRIGGINLLADVNVTRSEGVS
jgi:hypothetical protein